MEKSNKINYTASIDLVEKGLDYGEVEVLVSNSAIDRHGESIKVEGIKTNEVMKNPVVLWGHDYMSLPIGKIIKLWKTEGNLMARIKFDYDIYEFARTVYEMVKRGTVNAVSIGGLVKKWNADYTVVEEMEMLELSVVPVGAHPQALVMRRSLQDESVAKQYNEFLLGNIMKSIPDSERQNTIKVLESLITILKEPSEVKEKVVRKLVFN
jgi:HK97 family phage prohead protease